MKTPEQAAEAWADAAQSAFLRMGPPDAVYQTLLALIRQRDREVYEAGQIAMRERAAKEAEDFWGLDTSADRIRALPLRSK